MIVLDMCHPKGTDLPASAGAAPTKIAAATQAAAAARSAKAATAPATRSAGTSPTRAAIPAIENHAEQKPVEPTPAAATASAPAAAGYEHDDHKDRD